MAISDTLKKNLGKKLNGNLTLNKEVLRWKKSLTEVNKQLSGGGKKEEKRNKKKKAKSQKKEKNITEKKKGGSKNMVLHVTSEDFQEKVLSSSKPVLVDFYADWCVPCKKMSPIVDAVAEEIGSSVVFCKINIDENSELAERYSVMSIPTLILFQNGKETDHLMGVQSKDVLKRFVQSYTN